MAVRLRQVCAAAPALVPAVDALRATLGLAAGFHDPGVGVFGLENEVLAFEDTFVEVVAPLRPEAPAARWIARRGGRAGGYMVLFEIDDVGVARERARAAGVRIVFEAPAPGILGLHLHPRDLGGCIVSVDRPEVPGEWPWAGPDWRARGASGTLRDVTVTVADPDASAARWGSVLGCARDGRRLVLDHGGLVEFEAGADEAVTRVRVSGAVGAGGSAAGVLWVVGEG